MSLKGEVDLIIHIGDLRLTTTVMLFANLGAPFLLGVNALDGHNLAVSNRYKVLFSEADNATEKSLIPILTTLDEETNKTPQALSIQCDTTQKCIKVMGPDGEVVRGS